jgi:hypothetical protein
MFDYFDELAIDCDSVAVKVPIATILNGSSIDLAKTRNLSIDR